ncbi:triphosphoribosyl-dephospho-CoA synthase, partial [Streptomyces sp. SA15]|uniref:triphosphoribosyl-dephospho-CoA synthase n=1 Tax=Streptomyces sp. SA15 TaxID=934019 RepID=UPI0015CCE89C
MRSQEDETLAQTAVDALTGQLALAPKPGLPDPRDLGARAGHRDHRSLRWSARALTPGLVAMATAARRTGGHRRPPHRRARRRRPRQRRRRHRRHARRARRGPGPHPR